MYTCPDALRSIEKGAVYSFCQDGDGAVWMCTNYGLCRFNGTRLEVKRRYLPRTGTQICSNGDQYVYVPSEEGFLRYHARSRENDLIKGSDIDYERCALYAEGECIWAAAESQLWVSSQDSLISYCPFPREGWGRAVSALRQEGKILIAFENGVLCGVGRDKMPKVLFSSPEKISALFIDSASRLWLGFKSGGLAVLNRDGEVISRYPATRSGQPIREARTFCEDRDGRVFIGTIDGLIVVSPDGQCRMNAEYTPEGYAIWSLMKDRAGNIWIGTFYRGVYLCEADNNPFRTLEAPGSEEIMLVNELVEDRRGDVWVVTDRHGVFQYRQKEDRFVLVDGTRIRKFKCAWYDAAQDGLWLGEYSGGLHYYDISSRQWTRFRFVEDENSIYAITPGPAGELYLGTATGVFLFDPHNETAVCRRLPGYEGIVNALQFDREGTLWAGGRGLWKMAYGGSELQPEIALASFTCPGICCLEDGRVMVAVTGEGVAFCQHGTVLFYGQGSIGLSDNYTYFAEPYRGNLLITGTRTGISFMNPISGDCFNYSRANGLSIGSAREGTILRRSDGSLWIGGTDGIVTLKDSTFRFPRKTTAPRLEGLSIGGKPERLGETITLPKQRHSFSLYLATFDYSHIRPSICEYKLEGMDRDWTRFSPEKPIVYTSVPQGKYVLKARTTDNALFPQWREVRMPVVSLAAWYASRAAIIAYIVFAVLLIGWLLYAFYAKMLVSQRLHLQEQENEERMRFFINLSHELRTPLTMIIGQLGLFLRASKRETKADLQIESSYKNAQKMDRIVSGLLDFEKRNQGYSTIAVSETDLCKFLLDTRDWFAQYAVYRNIRLGCRLPSFPVSVMIDREQMHKVLTNLLNNAFKYTPDGGEITLSLSIQRLDRGERGAVISIADTGSGIPEDALERIFAPFYRASETDTQGTGIGLTQSRGIVKLHHGTLYAANRKGGGAEFTLTLSLGRAWMDGDPKVRLAPTGTPDVEDAVPGPGAVPERTPGREYTMLIVEDDAEMRMMLTSIFSNGYTILEASDGAEGFSLAKSRQPDIIISDVIMPVMDGMSLVAKLRQDFETCHIPVILLTAKVSSESEIAGINLGADDYIGKPFRIDVLEARCRTLLENRNILREKFSRTIAGFEGLTKTQRDADFLSRAAAIIDENILSSELGVALLCDKLKVSRTMLDQKIKGITGMTPRVFIETVRLKQACRLLESEAGNISEIAYMLGFSSPKYFTIRFKKQFGKTPTEWLAEK